MAMEKAAFSVFLQRERKRVNEFYELCKFYSDIWNQATPDNKVHPQRFMRDCKANRRAYELAQIDYNELYNRDLKPNERAKLLFGKLKVRKAQMNQQTSEQ